MKLPDKDATLLFAGKYHTDYSQEEADKLRYLDSRIEVRTSPHIPREDLQLYLNAADVVVLPFLDVLTSGSAITALGFGRPVIVPAIGCLPELIDDSIGILYDPKQEDDLLGALGAARRRDLDAAYAAARSHAQSLAWDRIARRTLEAYSY